MFISYKRTIGICLSTVLLGSLLVGCSSSTSSIPATQGTAEPVQSAKSDKPYDGQKITVVMANHPWTEAVKPMLPEFESKTGIKIDLQTFFEDQLSQKLTVSLTSGAATPDVFMYRPLQEGKLYFNNGWLEPLNNFVGKDMGWNWNDFNNSSVSTVTVGDKVSGIPLVTERTILYYRKDLLEKAGLKPPTTMEELLTAAKKLHDPANGMFGFVGRGQRAAAVTMQAPYLLSYGGDFDKNGKATLNTPEAIQAFTTYATLLKDFGPPGVLNMAWPQSMGIFAQGKAALYTESDSLFINAVDPKKSTISDKVGYSLFPAGPAGSKPSNITSWGLTMNSKSAHKEAAWEFLKWATNKETMLAAQKKGVPGARTSVWNSSDAGSGFSSELYEVMKKSSEIGSGYDRPRVVNVGEARDVVGNIVVKALSGEDIKAAAEKANAEYQAILDKEKK